MGTATIKRRVERAAEVDESEVEGLPTRVRKRWSMPLRSTNLGLGFELEGRERKRGCSVSTE